MRLGAVFSPPVMKYCLPKGEPSLALGIVCTTGAKMAGDLASSILHLPERRKSTGARSVPLCRTCDAPLVISHGGVPPCQWYRGGKQPACRGIRSLKRARRGGISQDACIS